MKVLTKLSLLALISLVFCPACGQSDGASNPRSNVEPASAEVAPETETDQDAPASLEAAMKLAKAEGKNVLVEYTDAKCPFCRRMNSQTLGRKDVKASLGENVVWYRFDIQKDASAFESRWGKQPTPTFVVITGDGETLHGPVAGVIPAANFLSYVAWAKTGEGPVPALAAGGS